MNKYEINEETIKKILLYSAYALPDRPGERGLKAENVKRYFYEFISKLVVAINSGFSSVTENVNSDLSNHYGSEEAHKFIKELIFNLQEKDKELGNSIDNQVKTHDKSGEAHSDIRNKITTGISEHDGSDEAHDDIRQLIKSVGEMAESAKNLASGKSKIYPMYGYGEFIYDINTEPEKYNVGDMFIFNDKQAPDFMLFEKDIEYIPGEDDLAITDDCLPDDFEFTPGARVVINNIRFVIQESGYDISKLATNEELSGLGNEFSKIVIAIDEKMGGLEDALEFKENAFEKKENTQSELEIVNHTEHSLGLVTSLNLSLPNDVSGMESIVNFRTGAQAPSFDAPASLVFSGDDCSGGRFYPVTHRIYEINVKEVLGVLTARVGACDFEVIE